jgi:hypothetical protein
MGSRSQAVANELHGEKIDIVDWSEDPAEFVAPIVIPLSNFLKASALKGIDSLTAIPFDFSSLILSSKTDTSSWDKSSFSVYTLISDCPPFVGSKL